MSVKDAKSENWPYLRIDQRLIDMFEFDINFEEQGKIFSIIVREMLSEPEKARLLAKMKEYSKGL